MSIDTLADDPGLLIGAIVLTMAVLFAIDVASRAFWRWWRR